MNKKIIYGVIIIALIIAGAYLLSGKSGSSKDANQNQPEPEEQLKETREFNIKAFRFGYDPNEIMVNKGDNVKIKIENTDALHGIRIPDLNISGNETIEFTAGQAGEFIWYCNNMCGSGHGEMQGKLIVK